MVGILQTALAYHSAGLCVIPIRADGSKAPALRRWHPYLRERPTEADLRHWFAQDRAGLAIICGKVSGNLETLDFETVTIYRVWRELVEARCPSLVSRLSWVKTPGHLGERGLHARYRCPRVQIPGSMALAFDPEPEGSRLPRGGKAGQPRPRLLIETRGEGGYALAPGSPAACHQTGRLWEHVGGPDLLHLPELTPQERDVLLSSARALSRCVERRDTTANPPNSTRGGGFSPGDDYSRRGPDWSEILGPHGWEVVRTAGVVRYWRRPDKGRGTWSATTGYCRARDGCDLLHVFSSNAHPFQVGGSYSKFRVYVLLNHSGDYQAGARSLAGQGFGQPQRVARLSAGCTY